MVKTRHHAHIDRSGRFINAGGEPYVPQGIGCYALLDLAGRGRIDAVRDVLRQANALNRPLLRINAYMDGGTHPGRLRNDDGSHNDEGLEALDRVLHEAKVAGVQLILTLANNWSNYGGAAAVARMVDAGLGKDDFWTDERVIAFQCGQLKYLASRKNTLGALRYRDDPTIFAWELCNEARLDGWFARPRTLVRWARHMSDALRSEEVTQPIAWGGSGHRGRYGEDLEAIIEDGAVDIATLHLYPYHIEPKLWRIESAERRIARAIEVGAAVLDDRARLCSRRKIPLLVEELGWKLPTPTPDAERASVMEGLLSAARRHGVGTLPWMIGEPERPDYDGLLVHASTHPQTWDVLRIHAAPQRV